MVPLMIEKLVYREREGFFCLRPKKLSQKTPKHTTINRPRQNIDTQMKQKNAFPRSLF